MPVLTGIHGIAQQFAGGYELERSWYDAVRDGLVAAGHSRAAEALRKSDLRVAFFADLFRPAGAMAAADVPYGPSDLRPGLERDLLTKLYEAVLAQEPSLGPPPGAMGPGRAAVQLMLDRLLRSRTFTYVAQRALIGDLKQVTAFLTDAATKQAVLDRVREKIQEDTRVLIGHSLGSVVAYEYLCCYQPKSVQLLVTLGSPLGIPNLIFDRLTPRPVGGAGAWPAPVARWVNVADQDDIVALRKQLADMFIGTQAVEKVEDRLVDNGDQPHAAQRYLNAAETGSALGDLLA